MALDLKGLDFTREEILERIASKAAEQIFGGDFDENESILGRIENQVHHSLSKSIDAAVAKIGDEVVAPRIEEYIRGCVLQTTNQWGEKKGEPTTFVEYLVARANEYVTEPVDAHGKTKKQSGYPWNEHSTRVVLLIERYLQSTIESELKQILADVNNSFASGLSDAVKLSLKELMGKVSVKTEVK